MAWAIFIPAPYTWCSFLVAKFFFFVKEGDCIIVFCCLLALLASHQVFFGLLLALSRRGLMCEVSTIECCYIKKSAQPKRITVIYFSDI